MKPRQRQAAILEHLQKQGKCSVEDLAHYFDTTGTTIRKDLVLLENSGAVIRTYGGVVLNKDEADPPIDHKTLINTHQKALIAEAAVKFIQDGDSIILDAGSTVLQMIPLLSRFNNITVMTNSLHIVNALSEFDSEQTILMPGGTFRKKSASFHGQLAENAFDHFSFDKLFMGTDGIDLNAGVTTFNEVFSVSKAMCNAAREVILMADSSKFGRKSPNIVCSLESVDKLITDAGIDPAFKKALEEKGIDTLMLELQEASRLPERLGEDFVRAANTIIHCEGKVIVAGIGKSGHIGKKIAATLASTGTPAFFVHPAEALHGDLGMIESRDVMLFISYSGSAKELDLIIPRLQEKSVALLAMTGKPRSPLALAAKATLDISVEREACPMHLAPTSSTVNTLMMGDALAMAVMQARGFNEEDFARSHPAGALGARLLNKVHHLMRTDDAIPQVKLDTSVMDAMLELSRTGLGLVAVCDDGENVKGVFTDGDLRRWLVGGGRLETNVSDAMTKGGLTLNADSRAIEAKEVLMKRKITAAPVVDEHGRLCGAINLQDFYQAGII
ncbi:hypothetical protein ID866_458 [Astraeus odoratus]|nr:hypothetical protein ID866_458 [Astraeus odoratus]